MQPTIGLAQDGNTPTGPEIDRAALAALYNATDGDNWYLNANWLSHEPIGNWHGVTSNDEGRVSEFSLWGINLNGTLPAEIGNLAQVQTMYFQ